MLLSVDENTLERMRAKLKVMKQDVRNARSNRGFKKRKVRNYRRKLQERGARYDLVVQRLNDVIDNLLELDDWKVGNQEETEAAVNLQLSVAGMGRSPSCESCLRD